MRCRIHPCCSRRRDCRRTRNGRRFHAGEPKAYRWGRVFLAAEECRIHQIYKDKIISAGDTDTVVTGKKLGHPVRALKTLLPGNFPKWKTITTSPRKKPMLSGGGLCGKPQRRWWTNGMLYGWPKCRSGEKDSTCKDIIKKSYNRLLHC